MSTYRAKAIDHTVRWHIYTKSQKQHDLVVTQLELLGYVTRSGMSDGRFLRPDLWCHESIHNLYNLNEAGVLSAGDAHGIKLTPLQVFNLPVVRR